MRRLLQNFLRKCGSYSRAKLIRGFTIRSPVAKLPLCTAIFRFVVSSAVLLPWRVGTCRWRVNAAHRLSYWLNFYAAVRKIERRLDCVNVRPTFRQWERIWSPSSTWNFVSICKQQNTLQLTTIKKIAVKLCELLDVKLFLNQLECSRI